MIIKTAALASATAKKMPLDSGWVLQSTVSKTRVKSTAKEPQDQPAQIQLTAVDLSA